MSRRGNAKVRCPRCHLHACLCLCAHIPQLSTRTRLLLTIHRIEVRKTTNTGGLAVECLSNSSLWVRGLAGQPMQPFSPAPGTQPVLLFPGENAIPLTEFATCTQPVTLVVPDGTWKQASKMRHRVPGLAALPMVSLPAGPPSEYRLRREERPGGLATMEAIARAFGILESPEVQQSLERVFRIMVERTLWSRGALHASEVTGGVPDGAFRHDPLSGRHDE